MKQFNIDEILKILPSVNSVANLLKWISAVVLWPFLYYFKNRKSLSIIDNGIYNIDKKSGESLLPRGISEGCTSPFLQRVVIETSREKSFHLTAISLENITYTEYKYSDILYDGGFFNESQRFIIVSLNNGNVLGSTDKILIKFQPLRIGHSDGEYDLVVDEVIQGNNILPGYIQSIYSKKLLDDRVIMEFFSKNFDQYDRLKIVLETENAADNPLYSILIYDSVQKTFTINLGAAVPMIKYPLINLEDKPPTIKRHITSQINKGSNTLDFLIASKEASFLSYNLVLWSGKKKFNAKFKTEVNIKVPHYAVDKTMLYGRIYDYLYSEINTNPKLREAKYSVESLSALRKQAHVEKNYELYNLLGFIYEYNEIIDKFSDTDI